MALDDDALARLKIDRSARPPSRGFGLGAVVALVAVVLVVAGGAYWWLRDRPIEVEVVTASASGGGNTAVLNASGYVVARREATVSSKVTGKIAEILIEEGMVVAEGQLLARLDDESLKPSLVLAQRQLDAARKERAEVEVRHAEALRTLTRVTGMRERNAISEADLDRAQSEAAALAARLEALAGTAAVAEATVRVREQEIEDLYVRAPFPGVIVSKDAQPGEMVSPVSAGGGFTRTGIATLVDMDSREIEVDVNESFINRVAAGQPAEAVLDAYPDWVIPSHVINIVPTADRQKATVKVRIAFDALDPRILANMGVKVTFLEVRAAAEGSAPRERPAVRVPAGAVSRDGAADVVWRVRGDRVERVAVSVGSERSGAIEILSGINAGDVVVATSVAGLADGAAVEAAAR